MRIGESERTRVREKLRVLYEQLGRRKELQRNKQKTNHLFKAGTKKIPQRQSVPGAIRDPRDMGSTRTKPLGNQSQETSKPATKNDFDIDDLWK